MTASADNAESARLPNTLRWGGLLAMLCVAVMRMVTSFNHVIVFDVDPALDPNPFAGLAAGSLWLDVALLGGAGAALLGHCLARQAIDWLIIAAALAPMFIVFAHGVDDLGDLRDGATWSAAAVTGVTIAHLCTGAAMRIIVVMMIAGVLGPLLVRGAANMTYEYDETLKLYEQQKELILADKGWEEGSASAKIYRRRMEQRQPTAWFATTNIFGSFMGAGLVLWLGLSVAAVRARLTSGWPGLCIIFALLCAAGLWLTESKGALLACAAGVGSLAVLLVALRSDVALSGRVKKLAPVLAVGLVVGALAGIIARGAILAESFAGEVSLLFRWHYIISAVRMFAEQPWIGVGPDEFQAQYMMHRVARNPEEVSSAHSMFVDWLATLGVIGLAWSAVVFAMLWRAGRRCSAAGHESPAETDGVGPGAALGATACIALLGIGAAIIREGHILDFFSGTVRIIGVLGFAVFALVAGHVAARADRRILDVAMLAAAIVLVVHGQIEMTWTQPGSVVMAWVMLGAASPVVIGRGRSAGALLAVITMCAAGWLALSAALPASRLQARMVDAARLLWPAAEARQMQFAILAAMQADDTRFVSEYARRRDAALRELGVDPPAGVVSLSELDELLRPALVERRIEAAAILEAAYRDWPKTENALAMASKQLGLASRDMSLPRRLDVLQHSVALGEESAAAHNDVASAALAIEARLKLYELTGQRAHMDTAIELARRLAGRDPMGVRAWVTLGNVLWRDDQQLPAAEAYRKALQHSDNFELDPYKQLDAEVRQLLESRIEVEDSR